MSVKVSFSETNQLTFQDYPTTTVQYYNTPQDEGCELDVTDQTTKIVWHVFFKREDLMDMGISIKLWKKNAHHVSLISDFLKNAHRINSLLQKALPIVSPHLCRIGKAFFEISSLGTRVISEALYEMKTYYSKIPSFPGMQLYKKNPAERIIFINLKWTPPYGEGTYGKVRKVLWLNSPDGPTIVAKKVMKFANRGDLIGEDWRDEVAALEQFKGSRGIISMIAASNPLRERGKTYIYFPHYDCSLYDHIEKPQFEITLSEKIDIMSQWLEGLAVISEKGVHQDIKAKNLLIKRGDAVVEGVIADFGTYKNYSDSSLKFFIEYTAPPECFGGQRVAKKYDVWGMGISIYQLFLNECDSLDDIKKPNWVKNDRRNKEGIPDFIIELINDMLHPDPEKRLSAKQALERFKAGRGVE